MASSWATIPAMAIMANLPLLISLVWMSLKAAGSVGLNPRGSNFRSPIVIFKDADVRPNKVHRRCSPCQYASTKVNKEIRTVDVVWLESSDDGPARLRLFR